MDKTKEYSSGPLRVLWDREKCIHSARCARGLPSVFKPKDRPWVQLDGAAHEDTMRIIDTCPSGALSYVYENQESAETESSRVCCVVKKGGPLLVKRTVEVEHTDGTKELREKSTAFCRCGASNNKPYCDGAHRAIDWVG